MRSRKNTADASWQGPYSVLMTLLFALFVVLYAIAQKKVPAQDSFPIKILRQRDVQPDSQPVREIERPPGDSENSGLKEALNSNLHLGDANGSSVFMDERGIVVRLSVDYDYRKNEIEIHQDFLPLLKRLGETLLKYKSRIRIEGHSAPEESPIGRGFRGWELSSERAGWLAGYFIKNLEFDPKHISVAGYSHYRAGRNHIEIVIPKNP
jgi:flagellar motor protein MotB